LRVLQGIRGKCGRWVCLFSFAKNVHRDSPDNALVNAVTGQVVFHRRRPIDRVRRRGHLVAFLAVVDGVDAICKLGGTGRRLFCGIKAILNGQLICHAIAVDEPGHIFDPAKGAPEPGTFTVQQCLAHRTFEIHACFAISKGLEVNPIHR
jgi:hypothetical protein